MYINKDINDAIWKHLPKYTHPSTEMEYIKYKGEFYFRRIKTSIWEGFTPTYSFKAEFVKSGALGGFQLMEDTLGFKVY